MSQQQRLGTSRWLRCSECTFQSALHVSKCDFGGAGKKERETDGVPRTRCDHDHEDSQNRSRVRKNYCHRYRPVALDSDWVGLSSIPCPKSPGRSMDEAQLLSPYSLGATFPPHSLSPLRASQEFPRRLVQFQANPSSPCWLALCPRCPHRPGVLSLLASRAIVITLVVYVHIHIYRYMLKAVHL